MSISKSVETATLRQAQGLLSADLQGEIVLMQVDTGEVFGLDAVGARIYALLATPQRLDDICPILCQEFQVDPATCRADTHELLTELAEAGVILVG